ncbi:hypothetical protein [Microbacterium sp. SORGH_AS_0862]|uniref:hypothetical protein n=1 Tax=Microbacterium sp. SORGH_AS_0862 TaxID=3041789 RepID=UPI002794452E|nr:hypothetical protein [Microbacterium sp. SORGH_AS_0862]MDQ1205071.1 hypothetical protein [Microbacterium sp. SORGH_AS_0862]
MNGDKTPTATAEKPVVELIPQNRAARRRAAQQDARTARQVRRRNVRIERALSKYPEESAA